MSTSLDPRDRLYELLPAIYRLRDAEQGEALRALLAVVGAEFDALQADIDDLYENWFIETCAEWVIPYVGDLLRVQGVQSAPTGAFSHRARVANTVGYRRRKGTAAVLEQLARDVSGWPARAVELFQLLETTQHVNHVRPGNARTPDLRDADRLELLNGPFDPAAHTADVRHISGGRGRYNLPNVGLFLWRLQSYELAMSDTRAPDPPVEGGFLFDQTGLDVPLFNRPRTETEITHLAREEDVPGALRRRPLHDELEALRQALVDGETPRRAYFGTQPVVRVFFGEPPTEIPPEQIQVCDLSQWRRPTTPRTYRRSSSDPPVDVELPIAVAVDPVLGRLAFPVDHVPAHQRVIFSYAFSGDLGGGPYNRLDSVRSWLDPAARPVTFQVGVTRDPTVVASAPDPGSVVATFREALDAWKAHAAARVGANGLIAVMDSRTYAEDLLAAGAPLEVEVPAGARLAVVAADWTLTEDPATGAPTRDLGQVSPQRVRPHLRRDVEVTGGPGSGQLIVDGLLVEGKVTVAAGSLASLQILHSTLVPAAGGLTVAAGSGAGEASLDVRLHRTICGPVELADGVSLAAADSILDSGVHAPGCALDLDASTIRGACAARTLNASNCIFTELVDVERRQTGCVRFCYLPLGSTVPRRHRCQPADESTADRVVPQFTSVRYGDPPYLQLAPACPAEITAGADDEGEMGAWHFLAQTSRGETLRSSLEEYLRVGLEAGVFFVT